MIYNHSLNLLGQFCVLIKLAFLVEFALKIQ